MTRIAPSGATWPPPSRKTQNHRSRNRIRSVNALCGARSQIRRASTTRAARVTSWPVAPGCPRTRQDTGGWEIPGIGRPPSDLVDPPLAEWFDRAGIGVEVIREMRDPHLGAKRSGQGGELLVGGVRPGVRQRRRLVDDQVGRGEPLDQARVV